MTDVLIDPAIDDNADVNSGDERYAGSGWDYATRLDDLQALLKIGAERLILFDSPDVAGVSSLRAHVDNAAYHVSRTYIDGTFLPLAGGTMHGDVAMNTHDVTGAGIVQAGTIRPGGTDIIQGTAAKTIVVGARAEFGQWPASAIYALFGNADLDHSVVGNYGILQKNDGQLLLNSPTGVSTIFRKNNVTRLTITDSLITVAEAMRMSTTEPLEFRDGQIHIASLDDGHLDLTADISIDVNGNIVLAGGVVLDVVTKTADYTATASDHVILVDTDTAGADVTITLPAAASHTGRWYIIKNTGTGRDEVIVDGNGAETIDGVAQQFVATEEAMQIVCDGTEWWIV